MCGWRRALVVHASSGGNTVPAIALLAATSEDRVREMIHRFNDKGMALLDPQWAGGRPRLITTDDEQFIVETATSRPEALGQPFTRWSIRKLGPRFSLTTIVGSCRSGGNGSVRSSPGMM